MRVALLLAGLAALPSLVGCVSIAEPSQHMKEVASFRLQPLRAGDKKRRKIPEWMAENKFVVMSSSP